MSARKDRENWERFRDDWENNRIVVHVDPFKAMDAWKNGVTHTLAPMVWFFEGEENFVGDSEIIALGGASNETKDRPLG